MKKVTDCKEDILKIKSILQSSNMPLHWKGKDCILELKSADYHWRQMEWIGFYFQFKFESICKKSFKFPGDTFDNVTFDLKGKINWDLKSHSIDKKGHVILNDKIGIQKSIYKYGYHGDIIACLDTVKDDENDSFKKWHNDLKGGLSSYEEKRRKRINKSRKRKKEANLSNIFFFIFSENDLDKLLTFKQGQNSNGKARKEKYMIDLNKRNHFLHESLSFS